MSDRLKLMTKGAWPEHDLSVQVVINCADNAEGCGGGHPTDVHRLMNEKGIPAEGCMRYEAKNMECTDINICRDCQMDQGCFAVKNYTKYYVEEYGNVNGEENMMKEIYARGPITCGIAVPQSFVDYTGGIYKDESGDVEKVHAISVVGWGEENGEKYWIGRNSWGNYWGEQGWFRIARGINNLAIESECQWAVPKVPEARKSREFRRRELSLRVRDSCVDRSREVNKQHVVSPLPHTYPEELRYSQHRWRELRDVEPQSAHPGVVRVVLGAGIHGRSLRSHQHHAKGQMARGESGGAGGAELRQCGIVLWRI